MAVLVLPRPRRPPGPAYRRSRKIARPWFFGSERKLNLVTKRFLSAGVVLVFALGFGASMNRAQNRGPSTPEERKRAVEIATLLENDPFNKDAKALSSELVLFLIQVPDI